VARKSHSKFLKGISIPGAGRFDAYGSGPVRSPKPADLSRNTPGGQRSNQAKPIPKNGERSA
jgi:hypothetical protein